jgi:hypothetical protein
MKSKARIESQLEMSTSPSYENGITDTSHMLTCSCNGIIALLANVTRKLIANGERCFELHSALPRKSNFLDRDTIDFS